MPAVTVYNKDWIVEEGMDMTAEALRKVKPRLEKGEDLRIRSSIDGFTRFALVSQGGEDHGRTGADGLILSEIVSKTVTDEEWLLNPLVQLVRRHKKIFVSRSGLAHDKFPTVSDVFLIDNEWSTRDLMLPQSADDTPIDTAPEPSQSAVAPERGSSYVPPFDLTAAVLYLKSWSQWMYGWLEDARNAPGLIVLGKGWTCAMTTPELQIPMLLISTARLVSALNLTFSSVVKVSSDSAITVCTWIVAVVDDFFEGSPIARVAMAAICFYLYMVILSGCFYCIGGIGCKLTYRFGGIIKQAESGVAGDELHGFRRMSIKRLCPPLRLLCRVLLFLRRLRPVQID